MDGRLGLFLCWSVFLIFSLLLPSSVDAGYDWQLYKKLNKKEYRSEQEELQRRQYWRKNRTIISRHNNLANQGFTHYKMKETPLTDYSLKETRLMAMTIPPADLLTRAPLETFDTRQISQSIPDSVDYRNSPCLPPIKYQGLCGCCWAFAATTPVSYQLCVKNNSSQPINLSEQHLVDCSSNTLFGNQGCRGGWYEKAWRYVMSTKGQMHAASYPYVAANGTCRYNASNVAGAVVKGYTAVGQWNETALKYAVALKGPISASICATCPSFQNYGSGIYEDPKCKCPVNHGITIVGYGTSFDVDYWIVRNSWGKSWGLGGYALLRRGVNQNNIAYWPSFPTIG